MEPNKPGAVSDKETWDKYLQDRQISEENFEEVERWLRTVPYVNELEPGSVFELGCGASNFLGMAATEGWSVAGIDYAAVGIDVLDRFLEHRGLPRGEFYTADIFGFDWDSLAGQFDLVVSFGFLEHFTNAAEIAHHAAQILRPGGLMLAQIPNLYQVNARLLKRYDPELWAQHIPWTPDEIEAMHVAAGLEPLVPAHYGGGYDQHMLMPWDKISARMPSAVYRLTRHFMSRVVQPASGLLPDTGRASYCASVIGLYRRPSPGT